jgi:hypothetical protein
MPNLVNDIGTIVQPGRRVADEADAFSLALSSGDHGQIEDAADGLAQAYDRYTGSAAGYSSRLGFDEVSKLSQPAEKDRGAADALASALVDMQVALVLSRAAQATGEIDVPVTPDEMDAATATLNGTLKALEAPAGTRFGFDEVTASQPGALPASPDADTAKSEYQKQVDSFYNALLKESGALLTTAYRKVSGLDTGKIKEAIEAVTGPMEAFPVGRLAARALEAVKRAIATLKSILGTQALDKVEEVLGKLLAEISKGDDALTLFLKYSYGYDAGRANIGAWLRDTKAAPATLDGGTRSVGELQQQMMQALSLEKRIIGTLETLRQPVTWVLKKFGGTLPLDLVMAGSYLLVVNVALVRGMDYADSSSVFQLVDGILVVSRRTLGVH